MSLTINFKKRNILFIKLKTNLGNQRESACCQFLKDRRQLIHNSLILDLA